MGPVKIEKFMRDLPDDKEIKREFKRIFTLFQDAPEKQLELAGKEISRAAFLAVTIDRLEIDISRNGYEEPYQNGAYQTGKKKTAAADLHVSYTKFLAVMKQLHSVLGAMEEESAGDSFDEF